MGSENAVVASEREEGLGDGLVDEAEEGHVARNAALAVAQDVEGAEIAEETVGGGELAQEGGVVVVRYGAGVVDAEGVEGVCEGAGGVYGVLSVLECEGGDGGCGCVGAGGGGEEGYVFCVTWSVAFDGGVLEERGRTRDQGVQAIDGDELLSQGEGDIMLVYA